MSDKLLLIIKTGNTIPTLLDQGEDFEDWFIAGTGRERESCLVVDVTRSEPLPALEEIGGIIVTGSPAYVTDQAEWNEVAAAYLRTAYEFKLPILGVCYGHQLLAWAFGGKVGFHPEGREIGSVEIACSDAAKDDKLMAVLPSAFIAQVTHQQSVLELPRDAVRLAYNDFEANHGFRMGENCWGIQFHPEFNAEVMSAYIRERASDLEAEGLASEELLEQVLESPDAASLLSRFSSLCA